jgi:hypothetical protein
MDQRFLPKDQCPKNYADQLETRRFPLKNFGYQELMAISAGLLRDIVHEWPDYVKYGMHVSSYDCLRFSPLSDKAYAKICAAEESAKGDTSGTRTIVRYNARPEERPHLGLRVSQEKSHGEAHHTQMIVWMHSHYMYGTLRAIIACNGSMNYTYSENTELPSSAVIYVTAATIGNFSRLRDASMVVPDNKMLQQIPILCEHLNLACQPYRGGLAVGYDKEHSWMV